MCKPSQIQPHLTFNYPFIYEDISASHMEATTTMDNLLRIASNQTFFSLKIKYEYWVFNLYPNDCHNLAFHFSKIRQVQPIHIP